MFSSSQAPTNQTTTNSDNAIANSSAADTWMNADKISLPQRLKTTAMNCDLKRLRSIVNPPKQPAGEDPFSPNRVPQKLTNISSQPVGTPLDISKQRPSLKVLQPGLCRTPFLVVSQNRGYFTIRKFTRVYYYIL